MTRLALLGTLACVSLLVACPRPTHTDDPTPAGVCPGDAVCRFDEGGLLLEAQFDHNDDGRVDAAVTYHYGASGVVVSADYDDQNDGTIDEIRHCSYDGAGDLHAENVDQFADGSVNERYVYVMRDGAILERHEDFDQNGVSERVCTFDPPCANMLMQGECARSCVVGGDPVPQ